CTDRWPHVALQPIAPAGGEVPAPRTGRDRNAKQKLVAKLLCRWWYVLPDWPPKDFDCEAALAERGYRKVPVEAFELEPDADDAGLRKAFPVSGGFRGLYRNPEGCLIDVRPVAGRPSYDQLMLRTTQELHRLVVLAYTRQLEDLDAKPHLPETELEMRQQLRQELAEDENCQSTMLSWFLQWASGPSAQQAPTSVVVSFYRDVTVGATIVSGCVAERVKSPTYAVFAFCMTSLIFPVSMAWTWGDSWLASIFDVGYMKAYMDYRLSGLDPVGRHNRERGLAAGSGQVLVHQASAQGEDTIEREFPSPKVDEQTSLPDFVVTPLPGGNRQWKQTSESDNSEGMRGHMMGPLQRAQWEEADEEMSSFMQTEHLQGCWYELLEEIRLKLEGYGKAERSQVAGHLIRLLAHRAVNSADGYLLGHMTASLTALLVAMRDDECYGCKVPPGDEKIPWLRQAWERITRYIPEHPGSRAAEGKWPEHDMPMIIRLFMHPVPTDTPPTSPIPIEDSLEAQEARAPKRACVRVELSSGSSDRPQTVALEVPIEGGRARLNLDVCMPEAECRASPASTVPAPLWPISFGTGDNPPVELAAPAGLDLGTFGLSEVDFEQLQMGWQGGQITVEDVTHEHGPYVAEQLLLQWGPPGEGAAGPGLANDQHSRSHVADTAPDAEEDDVTGLVSLWWVLVLPGVDGAAVQQRSEDFFSVARRVVRHLQDQGTPQVVIASALMGQVWRRQEEDYTLQMEDYYDQMGLVIDVDRGRAFDLTADSEGVIQWLEAEMWQEYIDELEGAVGESYQGEECREVEEPPAEDRDEDETVDGRRKKEARAGALSEDNHRSTALAAAGGGQKRRRTVVMAALMRTMALFIVEASQLMMVRVQQAQSSRQGEMVEVEVEEGDEEVWMQTSTTTASKRQYEEVEVEQMAEDEREARRQKQREADDLAKQLEEREQEEVEQARQDELLFLRHQGARYRDWEQWEVLHCEAPKPRRLQASLAVVHGTAAEQITCSLPLARGRAIDLRIQLHERAGDDSDEAPTGATAAARGSAMSEAEYLHVYTEWLQGRMTAMAVEQAVGTEMFAMFQAQRLVEDTNRMGSDGLQAMASQGHNGAEGADGSAMGGQDAQQVDVQRMAEVGPGVEHEMTKGDPVDTRVADPK
ncbi:unnamed protein product, partial [Symbiodinium microadriaticum]